MPAFRFPVVPVKFTAPAPVPREIKCVPAADAFQVQQPAPDAGPCPKCGSWPMMTDRVPDAARPAHLVPGYSCGQCKHTVTLAALTATPASGPRAIRT